MGGAYQIWKRYSGPKNPTTEFTVPRDASGYLQNPNDMDQQTTGPGFFPRGLELLTQGYGGAPSAPGASGPVGPTGPAGLPQMGGFGNSAETGIDGPQAGSAWGGMPIRPPSENSMQQAQTEAEAQNEQAQMKDLSPQRRYFWSTGLVDARPTQAPGNARTDFDATFGPNRAHMGSRGTTWAQRQANNAKGIADARELRGLSPY